MPGKALSPIFRDSAELTAHHSLSEKIQEAVKHSRFLIVLCSPAAKASHWVNEEIHLFRKLHGEASILCVICEGTPETSFPPALLENGREPLAANVSGGKENFKLGITQLAASMLGVGLDQLIQRDAKRRRNRLRLLSAGSLAFGTIMGGMAWTALDARDEAEVSRTEAEKMVEFMLTDLKQDLEPVGKLDILDGVGTRVTDYYSVIPLSDMDDDRLARRARARHLLGQVALDQRKMEKAKIEIEAAYQVTQEVLRRNPDDTDAIFAHAQSAYWVGEMAYLSKDYNKVIIFWQEYNALGTSLYERNPDNFDWIMEAAWGYHNMGAVEGKLGRSEVSLGHYDAALTLFSKAHSISPSNLSVSLEKANTLSTKSYELFKNIKYNAALEVRKNEIELLQSLSAQDYENDIQYRLLLTKLNYWEIKNSIDLKCNLQEPKKILQELRHYNKKDPSNLRWKTNYFSYTSDFLIQCHKNFPQRELISRVKEVINFANTHSLEVHDKIAKLQLIKNSK